MDSWEILYDESDVCLLARGGMLETAREARDRLKRTGYNCSLVDCGAAGPLDGRVLSAAVQEHVLLVTLEEGVPEEGFGASVLDFLRDTGLQTDLEQIGLPEEYAGDMPGTISRKEAGLDTENVFRRIQTCLIGRIR